MAFQIICKLANFFKSPNLNAINIWEKKVLGPWLAVHEIICILPDGKVAVSDFDLKQISIFLNSPQMILITVIRCHEYSVGWMLYE